MAGVSFDDLVEQFESIKPILDGTIPTNWAGLDRFAMNAQRAKGCIYLLHPNADDASGLVNTLLLNLGFAGFEAHIVHTDGNMHVMQISLEDIRQITYLKGKTTTGNPNVDMVAQMLDSSPLMEAAITGEVAPRYRTGADNTFSREFTYTVSLNGGGIWEFEKGCMSDIEFNLQRELEARQIQAARASSYDRRMIVLDGTTPAGKHAIEALNNWRSLLTGDARQDSFLADYLGKLQLAQTGPYVLLFEDDGRIETMRNVPSFEARLKRSAHRAGLDAEAGIFTADEGIAATLNWRVNGVNYTPPFQPLFPDVRTKDTLIIETSIDVNDQGIDFLKRSLATASARMGDPGLAHCIANLQFTHFNSGKLKNGQHYIVFHDPRGALFAADDMPKLKQLMDALLSAEQKRTGGMTFSTRLTDIHDADSLHHKAHFSYNYAGPYYGDVFPNKGLGLGAGGTQSLPPGDAPPPSLPLPR